MTAAPSTYDVVRALTDELARAGVRHACVTPGRRSTPLALTLGAHPALRVWSHVDERSAGFFALGLAKATRTPVVLACTSGTAAANLLPAVVEAYWARVPLVVLTADRPPELRDCAAGQTIDQLRLYGSHVRWFVEVGTPGTGTPALRWTRALAARAVALAGGPPAGPVHLNLPFREPLEPEPAGTRAAALAAGAPADPAEPGARGVAASQAASAREPLAREGRPDGAPWVRAERAGRAPASDVLDALAAELGRARRPLVVAGPLDDADPEMPAAVAALTTVLGAPLLAEPAANLGTAASLHVPAHDVLARSAGFRARHAPDLVLRLGKPPTSKALAAWLATLADCPQIVLDGDDEWPDPAAVASKVVGGALGPTLRALVVRAGPPGGDARWRESWVAAGRRARAALAAAVDAEPLVFEAHVARALTAALPAGAHLYAGNSLAIRALDWFGGGEGEVPASPARVLANRGANGIDGFVSSVLGAAAGTNAPVVGWCGDLALYHDLNGLLAVRRHGVRALLVVVDNGGGGIFDHVPATDDARLHDELFVTPHGLDFEPIVTAYGADFVRARGRGDLVPTIRGALAAPRTTVLVVPVERAASLAAHGRVWAAAVAAVESPV